MRIAILGAGAMGSWFGAQLALQGNAVQLLTTNQVHIDAIQADGLRLQHSGAEQTLSIEALLPSMIKTPVDLVLLFTKSFQSDAAMQQIAHALGDATAVMSLQNGLGNAEAIKRYVGAERIWVGMTMLPVDRIAPGVVSCKGQGVSYFGEAFPSEGGSQLLVRDNILAAFSATGLQLNYTQNIYQRIWEKVAFNAGMNALCALAEGTPGTVGQSIGAKALAQNVAKEVAAVASTLGVAVDLGSVFATIDFACAEHQDHKPSMLQDLEAGKRTEIDALCGAVVKFAESGGVAAPLNSTLTTLVKMAEYSRGIKQV